MRLGIYDTDPSAVDAPLVRRALYDFETGEWAPTSEPGYVGGCFPSPTPEELCIRFSKTDHHDTTRIARPETVDSDTVHVSESEGSVADGHALRQDPTVPLNPSRAQQVYEQEHGVLPVADDVDLSAQVGVVDPDEPQQGIVHVSTTDFAFADYATLADYVDVEQAGDSTAATN